MRKGAERGDEDVPSCPLSSGLWLDCFLFDLEVRVGEGWRTWLQLGGREGGGLSVSRKDTQVLICTSIHTSSIPSESQKAADLAR